MQTHQRNWISIQPSHMVSFVVRTSFLATVGLVVVTALLSTGGAKADVETHSACTDQNRTQTTAGGETLVDGANRNGTSPTLIDQQSGLPISNSQYIYPQPVQQSCAANTATDYTTQSTDLALRTRALSMRFVSLDNTARPDNHATALLKMMHSRKPSRSHEPSRSSGHSSNNAPVGAGNVFPYGQCTWWADQRYYQLHGVFVPWTINANAWQWVARAEQFHWMVSQMPQVGDILVLQPGVQGAGSLGHVAVVEKVLSNGDVIASSMNWGSDPQNVTYVQFAPGPGVAFVRR